MLLLKSEIIYVFQHLDSMRHSLEVKLKWSLAETFMSPEENHANIRNYIAMSKSGLGDSNFGALTQKLLSTSGLVTESYTLNSTILR